MADAIKLHNREALEDDDGVLFDDRHIITLAQFCAQQNPNFKGDRWFKYIKGECGKHGGKVK